MNEMPMTPRKPCKEKILEALKLQSNLARGAGSTMRKILDDHHHVALTASAITVTRSVTLPGTAALAVDRDLAPTNAAPAVSIGTDQEATPASETAPPAADLLPAPTSITVVASKNDEVVRTVEATAVHVVPRGLAETAKTVKEVVVTVHHPGTVTKVKTVGAVVAAADANHHRRTTRDANQDRLTMTASLAVTTVLRNVVSNQRPIIKSVSSPLNMKIAMKNLQVLLPAKPKKNESLFVYPDSNLSSKHLELYESTLALTSSGQLSICASNLFAHSTQMASKRILDLADRGLWKTASLADRGFFLQSNYLVIIWPTQIFSRPTIFSVI